MATAKSATRAREIGVRKVVGSGKQELIRQFLIESFVISLLSMVVAGITTMIIAFLTVSYQSIKAALANPVESLRYE